VLIQGRTLPSAARSAKAETRAGETHTGVDTIRGGEGLFLAERGKVAAAVASGFHTAGSAAAAVVVIAVVSAPAQGPARS